MRLLGNHLVKQLMRDDTDPSIVFETSAAFFRISAEQDRHTGMTTTHPRVGTAYASGYVKGRHAAKEHVPGAENPFRPGTSAFQGWNDGHYDERSARSIAIERHSASIWSRTGEN